MRSIVPPPTWGTTSAGAGSPIWKLAISPDPPLPPGDAEPPDGTAVATGVALAAACGRGRRPSGWAGPAGIGADEDEGDQQHERDDDAGYEACGDR